MDYKIFRNMHTVLRRLIVHAGISLVIAQVLAIIVFPIIEILLSLSDLKTTWYMWTIIGALHVMIGAYAIIGALKVDDLLKLANIDQVEQNLRLLEEDNYKNIHASELLYEEFIEHFHRQIALQTSLVILSKLLQTGGQSPNPESIAKLLAPLIRDRSIALGYRNDDLYNFVVYVYNEKDKLLNIFFRECDDRIQRSDRSWSEGVGHVGIAFANCETIIKSDARSDSEYKGKYSLATDDQYYVSFISSPIYKGENTKDGEIGIFVVTSNRPNHFEDDDKIIIESYSYLLSLYFSGCVSNGGGDE